MCKIDVLGNYLYKEYIKDIQNTLNLILHF